MSLAGLVDYLLAAGINCCAVLWLFVTENAPVSLSLPLAAGNWLSRQCLHVYTGVRLCSIVALHD
jgi:hypothetical protein